MIDFSHANSQKDPRNQLKVAEVVAEQLKAGETRIMGAMVESHLNEGRQDLKAGQALAYGVSITDGCLAFADTVTLLEGLAQAVAVRRQRQSEAE
jgi:3-deoxy-7-phosphoheptulonate synthase